MVRYSEVAPLSEWYHYISFTGMSQMFDPSSSLAVNAPINLRDEKQKSQQCDLCLTFKHPSL